MSVNDWIKRYQEHGLAGLQVKSGRGRKPILLAKAELQQELGKEFSAQTLKKFLKNGCRFRRLVTP